MSTSLANILAYMANRKITERWGAIAAFSRARLNHLLQQQFIENFSRPDSVVMFNIETQSRGRNGLVTTLNNVQLGPPRLSFENANRTDAKARLSMPLIAGHYSVHNRNSSGPQTVHTSFHITEPQGYWLEMDIELQEVTLNAARQGRVTLDLSKGTNLRCNLAGHDEDATLQLAWLFRHQIENLKPHRRVFVLTLFNLWDFGPLAVQAFRVLTHAAPGARIKDALNAGDGAVLVLLKLWHDIEPGAYPLSEQFPYLIPDDRPAAGGDNYSATLVVNQAYVNFLGGPENDPLAMLQFTGGNTLQPLVTETPHDRAYFGRLGLTTGSLTLEPSFSLLRAGDTLDFTLRDGQGQAVQASRWEATSQESSLPAGHGTFSDRGRYTAVSPEQMGHEVLHVVVTAHYQQGEQAVQASALVIVVFDDLSVSPHMSTYLKPQRAQPIDLAANSVSGQSLDWSLRGPLHGELATTGARSARFMTLDPQVERRGLSAQPVAVGNLASDATVPTTLLLVNGQSLLGVEPYQVSKVKHSATVQLHDDSGVLPGLPRRWSLIGGLGRVNDTGVFTAPDQVVTSSSVIQCEVVHNDVVFGTGFSVVDLLDQVDEPHWQELADFTIKVTGSSDGTRGALDNNGYQQLKVEVMVETMDVDGVPIPLSATELASLCLVHSDGSGAELEALPEAVEGIPESAGRIWQVSSKPNRFELASQGGVLTTVEPQSEASKKTRVFYLHTRATGHETATFHARFTDRNYFRHESNSYLPNGKITVNPVPLPIFTDNEYTLARARVAGGGAGPGDPEEDDFNFYLQTTDYWTLTYSSATGRRTKFETLEFVSMDGNPGNANRSMIAWESELLWETMFSWTGYVFEDSRRSRVLSKDPIDPALNGILPVQLQAKPVYHSEYSPGTLVISLHRDEVEYQASSEAVARLSNPLRVLLRDSQGNPHYRMISFLAESVPGRRNKLKSTSFTPPAPTPDPKP